MWVTPVEKIIVVKLLLSENSQSVFSIAVKNDALNFKIASYLDILDNENIECFKRVGNIIATEKGYFIALFEKDIDNLKFNYIEIVENAS